MTIGHHVGDAGPSIVCAAKLDALTWPTLRPAALDGIAGEIVAAATADSEADPAAVLATLLTHAGIVVGRNPCVRVGDDWHHARLFTAIVGQSARGRKGTSEAPVRRIWKAAEAKGCPPLCWRPGPMSSGEGLIFAIRDGDGTSGGDVGVADKRMLIVEGEFAAPLRAMQRQGNTLSTFIRSAWDGRTLEPLTKSSPIRATDPHIGIVGHITIAELKLLLSRVEVFNGFANRFLWFAVRRSRLVPLAQGLPDDVVYRLASDYGDRLKLAQQLDAVEFSNEARELYCSHYPDLTSDQPGLHGVVTARAESQVIRLALTYAVLDASPVITTRHILSALAVWEYCDASALYLFGQATTDPVETRVLEVLSNGPRTTTELHNALGRHASKEGLHAVLQDLQARGSVALEEEPTGGRPRQIWRLREGFAVSEKAKKAN